MSYVIKSSIQSQPSKVEIITVPSTLKASVAAQKPPKGFVVVERDSAKGHGHTNDKFKEVRPIKVPGSLLPQVIPEDIEQIERKERKQDKENLKQAKSVSKNISNKQHMVTQDGILTLKGIIKDYQKVYNPNIYLPSNSNKQNYQREKYKYVPGSNLFPLGNITTPREYSFSPTLSTESEDITSSDTFDELTRGRTFSSKDYKVTLSEVSDSESELISYNNFSHNASEKENIFHENVMSHKMPKNKDNDSPSCIMTEDGITLPLSSSKKNPTQSSVKKVVTFANPPEMQSTIDETNTGIVPVKQGYLRVRERPHSSILTDKDRNKKINSHTYQRLVNPYSRLAKNKPSGICNRAVKQGLLENIQGIPKNKKSSQRYDSSQKKVSQEKEKHPPDKETKSRKLSYNTLKCEDNSKNLDFVNENLAYLLKLERKSSDTNERKQIEAEKSELEKAISLVTEIRGKLQEHSSDAPSDLTSLISDLRSGRFDEDKYIISKRVDKCIRNTYKQAINEVREGRISSPVSTWSENRRAMWSDDNFERVPPTHPISTQNLTSKSQYHSSVGKVQENVPPLFYSPKMSRKIEMNKNVFRNKKYSYDDTKVVSKKKENEMKNMVDKNNTSNPGLKYPQEFRNENNKPFGNTYTVKPTSLQISSQSKLHIPSNRVIQILPGVSISPRNDQRTSAANRNKLFNIKHSGMYSKNSDLEERDLNENHCSSCHTRGISWCDCKCNNKDADSKKDPQPKKQSRNTPTLQEKSMKNEEDIKEKEKPEYLFNEEKTDSNDLINDMDETKKCKKKAVGRPEDNGEENELPGYFPEVRWEEVQIPDPPPVEGSAGEVEELEHKIQQHQFQQRLLNRLEEGLRQILIREVQEDSQEKDVNSPAELQKLDARVNHGGHVKQEQTMLATRSVLEKLVREQLTLSREQRQHQRASDNPVSLHEEEEDPDEDFQSTDVSTATSYTTPDSPSKLSALSTSKHGFEEKICTPASPPLSPKRHEILPNPIISPELSSETQDSTSDSFSRTPSPSPPPFSLPKTHIINTPDSPRHTSEVIPDQSPKVQKNSHTTDDPSPHQSQPHSPYVTPYQSPHPTPHSSPSHPPRKRSASDQPSSINTPSWSSHNHARELPIHSHGRVDIPPNTPCIQPNSDVLQDISQTRPQTPALQVPDSISSLSEDSEAHDIPRTPPTTPAPHVPEIETSLPIKSEAQEVPQPPPSTPAPQVPKMATTHPLDSEEKDIPQTPPPTPAPHVTDIANTLPMDLEDSHITEKEENNYPVPDEMRHIRPYGETWTQDADQVSRASDSRETMSPHTPLVVCNSSGNATVTSAEASDKTWVTMSEGEILQGAVDASLFEEGEILFHKMTNHYSKARSISLKQKRGVKHSISIESLGLMETISEGLLIEDLVEDTDVEEGFTEEVLIAASVSSKDLSVDDLIEDSLAEEGSLSGFFAEKGPSEGFNVKRASFSEGAMFCDDNSSRGLCLDEDKRNVISGDAEGCESVIQDSTYSRGEGMPALQQHKLQQNKIETMSQLFQENPELIQLHKENAALLARLENYGKFGFLSKSASVGSARSRSSK